MSIIDGWIKVHREICEKAWFKKPEYLAVWIYMRLQATHKKIEVWFKGEHRTLNPGQFITGRKKISKSVSVNEYKVERILSYFEKSAQQISQEKSNKNRLITILSWNDEQQQNDETAQQLHNNCTTTAQQLHTNKNDKNVKNEKKEYIDSSKLVLEYLNERAGKRFTPSKANLTPIIARIKEGFDIGDCRKVIDKKVRQWGGSDYEKYLRPVTLFQASKFEGYLNERERGGNNQQSIFQVTDDDQEALERMIKGG